MLPKLTYYSVSPINVTIEAMLGLDPRTVPRPQKLFGLPGYTRGFLKCIVPLFTIFIIVLLAVLVPSFDTIMALMGSAMAFSICIILPLAFHLNIFGKEIARKERIMNWFLIVVCSIMAVIGTVWVFLPKELTERLDGVA